MKIIDASAVVDLLVGKADFGGVGNEELACPHLLDSEVLHTLARLERTGSLPSADAERARGAHEELVLRRLPVTSVRQRIWELRHNLSAYDATYVALAEATRATSLVTSDARIARSPGPRCTIELLT